jgi:DNA-directed RNA polymerase specialized sigma24 family protein
MGMDISAAPETRYSDPVQVQENGDADARVAAIYVTHYRHLVGLASMLAGGRASGEEIAQETFLIALRYERRKPGYLTDPVWPWLQITAVRLAGRFRKRVLREILPNLIPSHDTDIAEAGGVEAVDVLRALRRLPPKMRLCVILAHVEDQSSATIATLLGCSTQNVDSQLIKGRQRLRTILGEDYKSN